MAVMNVIPIMCVLLVKIPIFSMEANACLSVVSLPLKLLYILIEVMTTVLILITESNVEQIVLDKMKSLNSREETMGILVLLGVIMAYIAEMILVMMLK